MKIRVLIIMVIIALGITQANDSFSENLIPSCHAGIFVSDNIQCYIRDSPPCPVPALEKNELCIVEKKDICEKGNMLKDGLCIPNTGHFRIDDPTFTKQHLLTGKPILDHSPDDFRELGSSVVGIVYTYSSLGLVGIIIGFFAIKKWKNRR